MNHQSDVLPVFGFLQHFLPAFQHPFPDFLPAFPVRERNGPFLSEPVPIFGIVLQLLVGMALKATEIRFPEIRHFHRYSRRIDESGGLPAAPHGTAEHRIANWIAAPFDLPSPLFRQGFVGSSDVAMLQIARGGPITLTDKRIIRYFMTIQEASQLVLQSGSMARNGELFVLDMGQPVKILELAESMIRLSGAEDIEIVETGLCQTHC